MFLKLLIPQGGRKLSRSRQDERDASISRHRLLFSSLPPANYDGSSSFFIFFLLPLLYIMVDIATVEYIFLLCGGFYII